MKISVLGCGRWGSFIAWYLANRGNEVCSWGPDGDGSYEVLRRTGRNDYVTLDPRILLCGQPRGDDRHLHQLAGTARLHEARHAVRRER